MDAGTEGKSEIQFSTQISKYEIDFFGQELAPPSGVLIQNYSWYIHVEKSPHKYAISWNNQRTLTDDYGGNFYFADDGIRVASSTDMLFVQMLMGQAYLRRTQIQVGSNISLVV